MQKKVIQMYTNVSSESYKQHRTEKQNTTTQRRDTTMGVINKFWKPAINFRKFQLPCPALRDTDRVEFNYLPSSALTSAL